MPVHEAAALLLAGLLSLPGPVARFTATSPVLVGQPVTYIDSSFDPAPGHFILFQDWIGREPSFQTPGPHLVELLVEDDRGLWGAASQTVYVEAPSNRTPSTPPPVTPTRPVPASPPALSATLSPTTIPRGGEATLELTSSAPVSYASLTLPATFYTTLVLPYVTVDYGQLNRSPAVPTSTSAVEWHLYVPWSAASPWNGTYTATIHVVTGGVAETLRIPFTVSGTLRWLETLPAMAP
jgi:hypothetical protein